MTAETERYLLGILKGDYCCNCIVLLCSETFPPICGGVPSPGMCSFSSTSSHAFWECAGKNLKRSPSVLCLVLPVFVRRLPIQTD